MMPTPDNNGRLELTELHTPPSQGNVRHSARTNALGIRHVALAVEDIDAGVAVLRARGADRVAVAVSGGFALYCAAAEVATRAKPASAAFHRGSIVPGVGLVPARAWDSGQRKPAGAASSTGLPNLHT